MYIGIIVKDRVECLRVLLKSLKNKIEHVRVVDASEQVLYNDVSDLISGSKKYIHNNLENYKAVVHNKNILIHDFLKSDEKYLFLIEDDTKILDIDCFDAYIEASLKYGIPHMMSSLPQNTQNQLYKLNDDIQVATQCFGFFTFFTRECIERVGLMYSALSHQCWEHIEHTARIHMAFNYSPVFFHFPDIINSWEMIKYCNGPTTNVSKETIVADRKVMMKNLGWIDFPLELTKNLDRRFLSINN